MSNHGKRLGEFLSCPKCKLLINPLVIQFIPGHYEASVPIPDRNILKCGACSTEFYRVVTQ